LTVTPAQLQRSDGALQLLHRQRQLLHRVRLVGYKLRGNGKTGEEACVVVKAYQIIIP
jgi:hypothetical protein